MDIGSRIRQLRENYELSQKKLSELAGISRQSTISEIENGKREPVASEIQGIAQALGTYEQYLMTGIKPENITLAEETGLSDSTITILKELKKNDPDKSLRITALLHVLLSDEKLCLSLSDYLYCQYDAFSGMMEEDKSFLINLFGESSFKEMTYFANLEPAARLKVMDQLKELREEVQNGKS